MTRSHTSIQLSTGVTLPYVERGDPDGVPTILLHGYSDSLLSFELLLPQLPDSIHAYALTQRGHAGADKPASGYRVEDYAGDVAAFMDAIGLERALLVGHSGGAYAAQRFALDHPERTLGAVLIGSFRSFHDNPGVLELMSAVDQLTDPIDPAFAREFQESCVAQGVPADFLDAIVAGSCQVPARVWKAYAAGLMEAEVPTDGGTITPPTLLMWGDQDAFVPRSDQVALLAAIPGSRLVTFGGVGHCPHWERPERAASEIVAFASSAVRDEVIA